jgi:zinc protease
VAIGTLGAQQYPTSPPAPMPLRPARFPPFAEVTLPNGLRLLVVANHRLPIVSISLSFAAGSKFDPEGKAGTAEMVAALLTKGAGTRDADAVAEAIEGVGGSLIASAGADFLTVSANVLSGDAPLAFALIGDAVMRPAFAVREIELYRTQTLSALQLEQSRPEMIASRAFARGLYGAHPYGIRQEPTSVRAITRADLVAFHGARVRPGGALLVIAGDMTLARARSLVEDAFRGWTGESPPAAVSPPPPGRARTEITLVHRPGSVQSNLLVGNLTWAPTDPRAYAATLANKVLGGGGDARLFSILREQKGWTYGAYSSLTRFRGTGYFSASAEVRTEVTDSALVELLAELRRIRNEEIPAKEFDDAKSALVGRFPLQVETAEQVAVQVSTARLLGLPADYVQTYRQRLAATTAVQAQAAARAAIRPDSALVVVVGDGAKLFPKLSAIAPVRIVSVDGLPLTADDLTVKAAALDLVLERLAPRVDSFAVLLQGNALGFQRTSLERTAAGWKYTEDVQIATFVQQHTEVLFDADLAMRSVQQTGKVQGQDIKVDVTYAGGRAKGSATTPLGTAVRTVQVDADVPAGALDENVVPALSAAFRWEAGAKITLPVFLSRKGAAASWMLTVTGEENVSVPAGTFATWKVDLSGADQPVTFWIEKAAPHRVIKFGPVGAPLEVQLVK